jgi:tetratricopeptide (TPR) repeat protein
MRRHWKQWLVGTVLAGTILALGTWWCLRQVRRSATWRQLPAIDLPSIEPAMAEIIREAQSEVLAAPRSGRAWGKCGAVLLAQDFLPEAVACFVRAEALDPHEMRWPYFQGLCLERLEADTALDCFRRAAERAPQQAVPTVHYAELLLGQGQLERAEPFVDRALKLAPQDPRVLRAAGQLAFLQNRLDDALTHANAAARADPQRHRIHSLLSQIHQRRGDQAAVEQELKALAATADADWPDPLLAEVAPYKRGTTWTLQVAQELIQVGRVYEAIGMLRRLGGKEAKDVRVLIVLGKAYLRIGNTAEAATTLQLAAARDPNQAPLHFEMGNLALVTRRLDEAVQHYREAIRLDKQLGVAQYNLGLCLRQLGDRAGALAAFEETIRVLPENWAAHRDAAALLLDADRPVEAIAHLEKAATLAPRDPVVQRLLEQARARSLEEKS